MPLTCTMPAFSVFSPKITSSATYSCIDAGSTLCATAAPDSGSVMGPVTIIFVVLGVVAFLLCLVIQINRIRKHSAKIVFQVWPSVV